MYLHFPLHHFIAPWRVRGPKICSEGYMFNSHMAYTESVCLWFHHEARTSSNWHGRLGSKCRVLGLCSEVHGNALGWPSGGRREQGRSWGWECAAPGRDYGTREGTSPLSVLIPPYQIFMHLALNIFQRALCSFLLFSSHTLVVTRAFIWGK